MILTCAEYLNEQKNNDKIIKGNYVMFLDDYIGDLNIKGVKGTFAIIEQVRHKNFFGVGKEYIYVSLEKPLEYEDEKISNFVILSKDYNKIEFLTKDEFLVKKGLYPIQFSKELKDILHSVKFDYYNDPSSISFLEIGKDIDYISYIPGKKCYLPDKEKYRQQARIGKVLKILNNSISDKNIEIFVAKIKAEIKISRGEIEIKVVTGDDIVFWYSETNYQKGGGTLNSSCMKSPKLARAIKFYARNPERIAMAIVENDKLLARSLIWKLDDDRIYMDRIYSINDKLQEILKKYAKEKGMITYYDKNVDKSKLKVTIKGYAKYIKDEDEDLPYFDTFDDWKIKKKKGHFILRGEN